MKKLLPYYKILKNSPFWKKYSFVFFIVLLLPFWIVLYYFFSKHIGEFGCFDDCNNFIGGYFLMQGKKIFTEFFFNHQLLMAYISYGVQSLFHPQTLYALVSYHRLLVFAFSVTAGSFLIYRFGLVGVGFILLYEVNKYYVFGNRFLAESFVVYLLVFMAGLLWYKTQKRLLYTSDYILAGMSTWFVIFMREPYVPLVVFLFGGILLGKTQKKEKLFALGSFAALSSMTLLFVSIPDMILNVFTLNKQLVALETRQTQTEGLGILKMFLYPIQIFFSGTWTIFREIQIVLTLLLLGLSAYYLAYKKQLLSVFLVWSILFLGNLRYVEPGLMYYKGFHLMVWYDLLVFFIMVLLQGAKNKYLQYGCAVLLICLFFYSFFSPKAFFQERVDTQKAFTEGYGHYYISGEVIRLLSNEKATLFVEGKDDMIYWQARVKPAYKYQFYTGLMPTYQPYVDARSEMFAKYPPDFYVGDCDIYHVHAPSLSTKNARHYTQLYVGKELTCMYVKNSFIPTITKKQWKDVHALGYYLRRYKAESKK